MSHYPFLPRLARGIGYNIVCTTKLRSLHVEKPAQSPLWGFVAGLVVAGIVWGLAR